ncbi:ATP-binding protein, partial [Thermodesulfobacteriota bacterium]
LQMPERPEIEVIVITGYANVSTAVETMKAGVVDYLSKPFTDDEFREALEEVFSEKKAVSTIDHVRLAEVEEKRLIQKREVARILTGASEDDFRWEFAESGSTAREGHRLSSTDKDGISLHNLFENAVEGILICNQDDTIISFNKSLKKMTGYSRNEVIGKMSFNKLFQAGEAAKFKDKLTSREYGGENRLSLFETNIVGKTGNNTPAQLSATVLFENDKKVGIVSLFRDLREIRRLEQEFADEARLLQQHKLISLGKLAASVVHEINNPLTGILNYIKLIIKITGRESSLIPENLKKFQKYLGLVESETDRCSKIVSNLLAFSRKSEPEFKAVNISELFEKSIMLSQHKLHLQNIQIRTELAENMPIILGDFNQIQQCLINLIFNAADAMPDGGTLTMACEYSQNSRTLEIRVEDTGSGIPEEDLPHIFDQFYTTKIAGNGLGLGLFTVLGIINRHKGTISVESELGRGTLFTIKLPVDGKGT